MTKPSLVDHWHGLIRALAIIQAHLILGSNATISAVNRNAKYCVDNDQCDQTQVCVFGDCRCAPNYITDPYDSNRCDQFHCHFAIECHVSDINRDCGADGRCVCKAGYREDADSKRCGRICSDSFDCPLHQVCVERVCECEPNYRLYSALDSCAKFACAHSSDCHHTGDYARECRNGSCVCTDHHVEDGFTKRCIYTRNGMLFLWFLILIPLIVVSVIVYYTWKRLKGLKVTRFRPRVGSNIPNVLYRCSPPPTYSQAVANSVATYRY